MATKVIAWNTGTGNITLTYGGEGNGTIVVVSDINDLSVSRSQTIKVKTLDGTIEQTLTITQAANEPNYLTFRFTEAGTFYWKTSNASFVKSIQYRKNNGEWTTVSASTDGTVCSVDADDVIKVKGTESAYANANYYCSFASSGAVYVSGNVNSLINFASDFSSSNNYAFRGLLRDNAGLDIDPNKSLILPSTTMRTSCYENMFRGCTNMTLVPELPSTSLSSKCYQGMFYNCKKIESAPVLPALTLASACYKEMFTSCSALKYIKAMFTTTPSDTYTQNWVSGVGSGGTFVKNSAAQWDVRGRNAVPSSWTIETESA